MNKTRHPAPQMKRSKFMLLDGEWEYCGDGENTGEAAGYAKGFASEEKINVPYAVESKKSGIGEEPAPKSNWYAKRVELDKTSLSGRVLLRFEGVDYRTSVWVNGALAGTHEGAYSAFCFDVTNLVKAGENLFVVRAEDGYALEQPRGKQRWLDHSYSCWYVPTTGIWKSVWLEFTGTVYVKQVKWTPVASEQMLRAEIFLNDCSKNTAVKLVVSREGAERCAANVAAKFSHVSLALGLSSPEEPFQIKSWSTDDPALYDVEVTVSVNESPTDVVQSYFGFRDIRIEGGNTFLNGAPLYQKLVLYQGYWADGGLTPPSDEAVENDLAAIKAMGFNGLRVHQKIESEYFLSCADRTGLLVWCEMPSPHAFNDEMKEKFIAEWAEILRQKYNHPCIVAWLPFNESWGIRGVGTEREMQTFADAVYMLTKAYDPFRPVVTNDGWENVKTDYVTVHNYEQDPNVLYRAYSNKGAALTESNARFFQKRIFAEGYAYAGQPVIVSEYGGLAFLNGLSGDDWGYGAVATEDDFCKRFGELCRAIKKIGYISGYCYTQYSDVWQEKNGLVTMDRKNKVDFAKIKQINDEVIIATEEEEKA